jgi:hypothetical protein
LGERVNKVLLVHGIAQQYSGPESLRAAWLAALMDGVTSAGGRLAADDVAVAFYGDLFRPTGSRAVGVPDYDYTDVRDPFEQDLLSLWWQQVQLDTPTRARTPNWVQRAVYRLCASEGVSESALIGHLKQVRAYFSDDDVRQRIRDRVVEQITEETKVLVGHSLGSVVAYEVLCGKDSSVESLVTLGSPLGTPHLIFDRLEPAPRTGRGQWPRSIKRWTNVADQGDVVPLVKRLGPLFDGSIDDVIVHNGAKAHDLCRYLTARETGIAISASVAC